MSRGLRFDSVDQLPERMRAMVERKVTAATRAPKPAPAPATTPPAPKRKYRNEPTVVDGIRFDSRKEARYYEYLKLCQSAGDVIYWLRQVPIHLPGGTRYVVDFQVHMADGHIRYVDVKGRETQVFRIKKREIEHQYPIRIELA